MSWLTNKPQSNDTIQFASMGLGKTVLLVGLGNPGNEYTLTRHNIGFYVLDTFVEDTGEMGPWSDKKDFKGQISTGQLGQTRVIALKPSTFMNVSGESVQAVAAFYKIGADDILVVHDELDVDFGQIRLRRGGSSAGHNGIKSVTQHLGENYGRVRVGIGPKRPAQIDSADFVLQRFSTDEQSQLLALGREASAILNEYVYGGELPHETRSFII
ncbi:MAG TPA: aminoacyl-tRNA hydrolase [Candidatus Saccharimonadales bacterium]